MLSYCQHHAGLRRRFRGRWTLENRNRRRGLVGPLLLVAAGIFFLLSNLGLIGWDAWQILFRFWPVLLIALGLEILIGRRSLLGSVVVVIIVLALIAGGLAFFPSSEGSGLSTTTQNISQPLQGAKGANVDIAYGAGQVSLGPLTDSDLLVSGTVSTSGGQETTSSFQMAGETANYRIAARLANPGPAVPPWVRGSDSWSLRLNSSVPLSLRLNGGVGTADIDLSQLKVTSLDANLGVGKTTITTPASGHVQGRINAGIGEVLVVVPSGMGVRLQADSGLGGLNVPPSYIKQGNLYVSPDYATAQNKLDLTVKGGIGKLTIQQ